MKKAISLALALVLCLGLLCVPAGAAGLDAAAAKAYLDVLSKTGKDEKILYTELVDMDGNGSTEMVVISGSFADYLSHTDLQFDIWAMQDGNAVRTATASLGGGRVSITVRRINKGGKCYYRLSEYYWVFGATDWTNVDRIFGANGLLYEDEMHFVKSYEEVENDPDESYRDEYDKLYAIYEGKMSQYLDEKNTTELNLHYNGEEDGKNGPTLATVQKQLADAASTASNTATATQYGTYQINIPYESGMGGTVFFDAVKVEKVTISVVGLGPLGNYEDYVQAYQDGEVSEIPTFGPEQVIRVKMKPGSSMQVVGTPFYSLTGKRADGRYETFDLGAPLESGTTKEIFKNSNRSVMRIGFNPSYYVELDANAASSAPTAYASTQTVSVDGKKVTFQMYALKDASGNPTNYIKIRDLASVLNGTKAQFGVGYDGAVNLIPGQAYTPNGSEMKTPYSGDRAYTTPKAATKVNGKASDLKAILLSSDTGGGFTYYKLRDLGKALGFNVGWSKDKGVFIETNKPYED